MPNVPDCKSKFTVGFRVILVHKSKNRGSNVNMTPRKIFIQG